MLTSKLDIRGVSIIFAVFTLLLLSVVAVTLFSLISSDIESAASRIILSRALGVGEAGLQIGAQAIKNDVSAPVQTDTPTNDGYHGMAYLEGYEYAGSDPENVIDPAGACLHGNNWQDSSPRACSLYPVSGVSVSIWNFRQKRNLIGTRIKNVEIIMRARRSALSGRGSPGPDPIVQLEYTTDGGGSWTALGSPISVSSGGWGPQSYVTPIPFGILIGWDIFMNQEEGFRIRARRLNSGGRKACEIDWLALRVTFQVDAQTEEWFTDWMEILGNPKEVNMALDNGEIISIAIEDESGKIHLNYATQALLQYLMEYNGIPSTTATALSNEIIDYRDSNLFDTVEELKQVSGITDEYYNLIEQDLTVYSWINNDPTRPSGPRAPVNINTASMNALKAIFRCAINNENSIERVASSIMGQRIKSENPFTHMYSTFAIQPPRDLKSFAGFIEGQGYLDDSEKALILANADATFYNRDVNQDWTGSGQTAAEFCYYSNTFLIKAIGKSGDVSRSVMTAYGHAYDYNTYSLSTDGALNLPTHINDTNPKSYWRERR